MPTKPEPTKSETSTVVVKVLRREKTGWVRAAQRKKQRLEDWVTENLNDAARAQGENIAPRREGEHPE